MTTFYGLKDYRPLGGWKPRQKSDEN